MIVPCLREIIETFKSEVFNLDYKWFKKTDVNQNYTYFFKRGEAQL